MPPAPRPFLKKLGINIKRLRTEQGLSQEAFADVAHLDRSYMSGIERGVRNVSVLNLLKIAKALSVPIGKLFEFE